MKLELLVIADQHATVNMYPGPVHTARHTLGIGFARSIGPMITHDFCGTLVPQRREDQDSLGPSKDQQHTWIYRPSREYQSSSLETIELLSLLSYQQASHSVRFSARNKGKVNSILDGNGILRIL
ncbi:hypothetical protein KY285_021289 [Solanum tuberosum]|nr:hypothetical protein KY285_021289 [Solanum tuberosum]